jgi:hypothetical protein
MVPFLYVACCDGRHRADQPPAEIVTTGAPSFPPVSVRVITNIRKEKSFFDW